MRQINISTDVFAKIWSLRQGREETENAILSRILDVAPGDPPRADPESEVLGVNIPEFGVHFAEGAEIFRVYKGTEYRARATRGDWLMLNDNKRYPSLHKLSTAVVGGNENAWNGWKHRRTDGSVGLIDELRDRAKVPSR